MSDPFRIAGPAVVSFSGGRSSGYMLRRILAAHGGTLPADVVVLFANTGREDEGTLEYVRDCGENWGVPIVWLEYRHAFLNGAKRRTRWAEVVTFETASRKGEPFDMLLESKKIVPDRSRRFCTEELKVRTIQRYVRSVLGWSKWLNIIGFRADESVRVETKKAQELAEPGRTTAAFPLADAGVQEFEVLNYWRRQSNFDLQLDADGDGGNCDGCFMFSSDRIGRMFQKYPDSMAWWPAIEAKYGTKTMRPSESYASIRDIAANQGRLPWDNASPCNEACGA